MRMRNWLSILAISKMAQTFGNMRYNGHLQYQIQGESKENEFGELVESESYWSDPKPCHIHTNNDNRKGKYEDGVFRQSSFTILCEQLDNLSFNRVRLVRQGEELGEYGVMNAENLESQNRTQITV